MNISGVYRESILNTIVQVALENKKPGLTAQAQTPKIWLSEVLPDVDTVDISEETKKKTDDFQKMLDDMRSEMQALREGLKRAGEAGDGIASAWKERIKCLQIAMRIMAGDKVPVEDHRYLLEKDSELYSRAISLRVEKADPKEYDRLSEDEETRVKISMDGSADVAPIVVQAQSSEVDAPPAEG